MIPPPPVSPGPSYASPPLSPAPYQVTCRSRSVGSRSPMLKRQDAIQQGSSGSLDSPQTPKSTLSVPSEVLGVGMQVGLVPTSMAYSSVPNVQRSSAERPNTLFHHSQPALYTSGRTPTRSVFTFHPKRRRSPSPPSPPAIQMDTFGDEEESGGSDQDLLNAHTAFTPREDPTPAETVVEPSDGGGQAGGDDEEDEGVFVHEWEEKECDAEVEKITSAPDSRAGHSPSPYPTLVVDHHDNDGSSPHPNSQNPPKKDELTNPPPGDTDTSPAKPKEATLSSNDDASKDLCQETGKMPHPNSTNQPANTRQDADQSCADNNTQGAVKRTDQDQNEPSSSWRDPADPGCQMDTFPQSESPVQVVIVPNDSTLNAESDQQSSEEMEEQEQPLLLQDDQCSLHSMDSALTSEGPAQFRLTKDNNDQRTSGSLYVALDQQDYQYGGDDFV